MPTCNICKYAGRPIYKSPCSECKGFSKYEYEKLQTNADRIRSMSDEELAEFLWDFNLADVSTGKIGEFGPHMFRYRLKEWLQQPAEKQKEELEENV